MALFVKSFIDMGDTASVEFVNPETLLDAREHPENTGTR